MFKLGKTPARPGAVKFAFADFTDTTKLPTPPKHFGHEDLVASPEWQMLGNDKYGDCVFAGAAHETMMWAREGGQRPAFNEAAVLSDYTAVTGFNPNDPSTDQGTDMQAAASYRRTAGIRDATGARHTIAAYLAITPGDIRQTYQAMWLFGAVGIGFQFPVSAWDQFDKGKPWSKTRTPAKIEGGHYVPLVAKRTHLECVTWGKFQSMTVGFYQTYCDEALAYVSLEALTDGRSPEGFDAAGLQAALAALGH